MRRLLGFGSKAQPEFEEQDFLNGGNEQIDGLCDLYSPEQDSAVHIRDIADVLCEMGKMTSDQTASVRREHQKSPSRDIAEIIQALKFAAEPDISIARATIYGFEFRRIIAENMDKAVFERLDKDYIKSNRIMPVSQENGKILVATSRPADLFIIEDVKKQLRADIEVIVCLDHDIDKAIDAFDDEKINYDVDDIISDMGDVEVVQDVEKDFEDLEKMAGQSPVIKFVNYLISNAISEGASDIHIEPKNKNTRIRYRIDGVLFETMQSPLKMHPAVVSRIKIMANLDISERRLPQDGKISVIVGGRGIDLRVSTLPTNRGEKVVIRILDSQSIMRGLEHLGMSTEVMETFREQIKAPHGILLVTGPTGSGKSTTLYSALGQMDGDRMNISTVEDPVEYELEFCNQVQVLETIGMSFASALRSLLRQDPDIIMIGEIRDQETARIAVQAALTGHLVLSTLHTNDAPSSITRLVNIGIDPFLIAASLNAVVAQRLVRKICPKCKQPYELPDNMKKHIENAGISPDKIFHGAGCDACRGSGYVGRIGIYELLLVDDYMRNMINSDASATNLRNAFLQTKRATLFDDGMQKVAQGLTTLEEILRVTESNKTSRQEKTGTSESEIVNL